MNDNRRNAILLLGPTGSGKTPLGDRIEAHGLWNSPFLHFDFGQNLRDVVTRGCPDENLTQADIDFLKTVLTTGALLEDEHFPIAERVFRSFLARHPEKSSAAIVLNGLPRHTGQAVAMETMVDVRAIVLLECTADAVLERLVANTGGDRTHRTDDDRKSVAKKLAIYQHRTAPLVEHYRNRSVPIVTLGVTPSMTPEQAWTQLATQRQDFLHLH